MSVPIRMTGPGGMPRIAWSIRRPRWPDGCSTLVTSGGQRAGPPVAARTVRQRLSRAIRRTVAVNVET